EEEVEDEEEEPSEEAPEPVASTSVNLPFEPVVPPKREAVQSDPEYTIAERLETDEIAGNLVEEHGEYDPTLELSSYRFPTLDLLNEYDSGKSGVTQEELNQNKDKIVETLVNFKIGIQSVKATI